MALTKAQVSLVTVTALGIAPGGYEAQLSALATQKELAAFIGSAGLLSTGTNAEFALAIGKNVGLAAGNAAITSLFNALESGTSRADAVVDFANGQLVAGNATLTAALAKAEAYTGGSMDLAALKAAVAADVVATPSGLIVEFKDSETDQTVGAVADANVTIHNIGKAQIDAGANKISADFTFKLANQIGTETYDGKFLSPIIDAQAPVSTGSAIYVELLDLRAAADGKQPLERLPVNGFGFTLDGKQIVVQSDAIHAAKTYAELETAIKARLVELGNGVNVPANNTDGTPSDLASYAKLANFTVAQGSAFSVANQSGTQVSGTQIVLTDTAGATLAPQGFSNKDGVIADPGYTLYAQLNNVAPTTVTQLITTNLEATNVGYGSQGAAVNIAGQSNSDKGVEELKITAKSGVWFTTVSSKATTHHLERIELQTGSNGYFRVGTQKNDTKHLVALVDETFATAGLTDVQELEAGAVESVAVNSHVTDRVIKAEYNLKDTGLFTADDANANITYNLTSGADVLQMKIDSEVVAYADTKVSLNTGAGNDFVHLQLDKGNTTGTYGESWLLNQQLNKNVEITATSGDNTIWTEGSGDVTITTGAGNDTVYADNSGRDTVSAAPAVAQLAALGYGTKVNGLYVVNAQNVNAGDILSNSANGVDNDTTNVAQVYNTFKNTVSVSFKGLESQYITIDSTNYKTSTQQVNQAIKKAINEDATLNKLIVAKEFPGNVLVIESLIDGVRTTGELTFNFVNPAANGTATTALLPGQIALGTTDLTEAAKAYAAAGTATPAAVVVGDLATNFGGLNTIYNTNLDIVTNGEQISVATVTAGAGAVAAVQEVQTIDFAGATTTDGNITVGGITVAILNTDTAQQIADKVVAAVNGQTLTAPASGGAVTATNAGGTSTTVTITYPAPGAAIASNVVVANGTATLGAAPTVAEATPGVTAAAAVNEVQTINLGDLVVQAGETLTFTSAGLTGVVTYTNNTGTNVSGDTLASAVATAITADANATAVVTSTDVQPASGPVVTVTYGGASAGTDVAQIVVGGTGLDATLGTDLDGAASTAHSDNVINVGAGNDVVVLGTGALSNDKVVLTGSFGKTTVVNFDGASAVGEATGGDLLDFTSYLDANYGATGSAQVTFADRTAGGTDVAVAVNEVTLVDFSSLQNGTASGIATSGIAMSAVTAAQLKVELDVDFAANAAASKQVFLIHNNNLVNTMDNTGEYLVVTATSTATAGAAGTAFNDVTIVGTMDFGDAVAFAGNIAGFDNAVV